MVTACIALGFVALLGLDHPDSVRDAAAHGPPVAEKAPSGKDWPLILARVRSNALAYSSQLPD
ncbi:MAG: hypothetical protein F4Z21_12615, partial [Acidobacteria bacterium]|nr:hypothetical protein [Acidobacteriota bacterium]